MVKAHKKKVILNTEVQSTTNNKLKSDIADPNSKFFNCRYSNEASKLVISDKNNIPVYHWKHKQKWLTSNDNRIAKAKSKTLTLHTETYVINSDEKVIAICRTEKIISYNHTILIWILEDQQTIEDLDTDKITSKPNDIKLKGDFTVKRCIWYDNDGNVIAKTNREKLSSNSFFCTLSGNVNCDLFFSVFIGLHKMLPDTKDYIPPPVFIATSV